MQNNIYIVIDKDYIAGPVRMEKLDIRDYGRGGCNDDYLKLEEAYNDHLASLPRIARSDGKWQQGQELREGVDFKRSWCLDGEITKVIAIPIEQAQPKEQPSVDNKHLIEYIYDFAWHYGRFWHLGDADKIKAAIKERFQLPEEWIVERGNIDEIRNKFYGEWLNKPMDGVDIDQIFEWFVKHLYLSPAQVAKPPQPSVEALAEQIAKNWDVYYTREGEPQNNVISAMVEMHQAASQPISAEDWKEKVEVEAKNFSEGWGENDDEKSFIAGAEWALQYLQQQQKKEALDFINKVKYPNHYMGIPDNATKEDLLFIIAGLEEGCEQWKAEYENLKAQSLQQPSMRWETERDPSIGDNYYCIIYDDWGQQRKAIVEWAEHSNGGYKYYDWCLSDLDNAYGVREDTKVIAWLDESTSQLLQEEIKRK